MLCKNIKVVAIDVDGVLTDGIYQISSESKVVTKSFYTRDFNAIEKVLKAGIKVFIVTQSHDQVIEEQIKRICGHSKFWNDRVECGSLKVFTSIENKEKTIESELSNKGWGWENVVYIGDAENDVECMKKARITGCPTDAIDIVKDNTNYISEFIGGKGAVYDICTYILKGEGKD